MSFTFKKFQGIERKRLKTLVMMAMAMRYPDQIHDRVCSLIEAHIAWINEQYGKDVGEKWLDECIQETDEVKNQCRKDLRASREGVMK